MQKPMKIIKNNKIYTNLQKTMFRDGRPLFSKVPVFTRINRLGCPSAGGGCPSAGGMPERGVQKYERD